MNEAEVAGSMIEYLIKVAPVAAVLGTVLFFLWKEYIQTIHYVRKQDKENLETLKSLAIILDRVVADQHSGKNEIIAKVEKEAETLKDHVNDRITGLLGHIRQGEHK
jgi:hypothetical protein